jgi:hypothetical protein
MTTEEIISSLDKMIKDFGAAANVRGLADEQISMGNYKQIMARYQIMIHNLMRLMQEQSEQIRILEEEILKKDKPGQSQIG